MAQLEQLAWTFSKPSLHCFSLHPAYVLKANSFQKAAVEVLRDLPLFILSSPFQKCKLPQPMIHHLLWTVTSLHLPGSYQHQKLGPAPCPDGTGPPQRISGDTELPIAFFRGLLPSSEQHKHFLQGFQVQVILKHPSKPGNPFHIDGAINWCRKVIQSLVPVQRFKLQKQGQQLLLQMTFLLN